MLDHLGIQCNDVAVSAAFYDAFLSPLGASRLMEPHEGVIGFGIPPVPNFWLGPLSDDHTGWREDHIAFTAPDRATVRACHDAAVALGAEILHAPREWPIYHPGYFGVFVRDPDGNNVEVVCHVPDEA
jgi:catechol 2,3-dioxygenase-like lactoylglutathione lyase family enzyme